MLRKILVIGGAGFIGGRLCVHLASAGHELKVASRRLLVESLVYTDVKIPVVKWIIPNDLERAFSEANTVIHVAGMNAKDCKEDPFGALAYNGITTAELMALSRKCGVDRFIYFSTAHIYCDPLVGTLTEATIPSNQHPYATSHLVGENAVLGKVENCRTKGLVFRLSNSFGTPEDKNSSCWSLLINDLCRQCVSNGLLVLKSSTKQQRDFIALEEVCRIVNCFVSGEKHAGLSGVFNLGSGKSISVLDAARHVQNRCNKTLGFLPRIKNSHNQFDKYYGPLRFEVKKLMEVGITPSSGCFDSEIDRLLIQCTKWFK
jgi:UDP-glucose 4-epimerase